MHLGKPHLVKEKTWFEKELDMLQSGELEYKGIA
jgi:hypothetical protein